MFSRTTLRNPRKPCTPLPPAGFWIGDYINPKQYFNFFRRQNDPSVPSSASKPYPDPNAPPTLRLADMLARGGIRAPGRPSAPMPDHPRKDTSKARKSDARPEDPFRRGKHGPKHLSFQNPSRRSQKLGEKRAAARKTLFDLHHHRRTMARARQGLSRLRREADRLIKPERMTDADRIFMKELEKLQEDQEWQHGLEEVHEQLSRAANEAAARRLVRDKLDSTTELRNRRREATEYFRAREEARKERLRQREQAAIRAEEAKQRAHEIQERKLREEQERLFREELARKTEEDAACQKREKEEKERQLREQMDRLRREAHVQFVQDARDRIYREEQQRRAREAQERERRVREELERAAREERARTEQARRERERWERQAKEERERQAREQQERQAREQRHAQPPAEEAGRAAQDEQIRQYFAIYEGKWHELGTNKTLDPIDILEMPWPVFGIVSAVEQITYENVKFFVFHPQRPGVEGKSGRDKVKSEVLRFHPDKFNARILPKIQPSHHAFAQEVSGAVARILTRILTEEEK